MRALAVVYGCHVTVADLTESCVEAGRMLTERLGMQSHIQPAMADALELPFGAGSSDPVWKDKQRLHRNSLRVLTRDGMLLLQEPMAAPVQPPILPTMWAINGTTSPLLTHVASVVPHSGQSCRRRSRPARFATRRINPFFNPLIDGQHFNSAYTEYETVSVTRTSSGFPGQMCNAEHAATDQQFGKPKTHS